MPSPVKLCNLACIVASLLLCACDLDSPNPPKNAKPQPIDRRTPLEKAYTDREIKHPEWKLYIGRYPDELETTPPPERGYLIIDHTPENDICVDYTKIAAPWRLLESRRYARTGFTIFAPSESQGLDYLTKEQVIRDRREFGYENPSFTSGHLGILNSQKLTTIYFATILKEGDSTLFEYTPFIPETAYHATRYFVGYRLLEDFKDLRAPKYDFEGYKGYSSTYDGTPKKPDAKPHTLYWFSDDLILV